MEVDDDDDDVNDDDDDDDEAVVETAEIIAPDGDPNRVKECRKVFLKRRKFVEAHSCIKTINRYTVEEICSNHSNWCKQHLSSSINDEITLLESIKFSDH